MPENNEIKPEVSEEKEGYTLDEVLTESPLFAGLVAERGLETVKKELMESRAKDLALLAESRKHPNLPDDLQRKMDGIEAEANKVSEGSSGMSEKKDGYTLDEVLTKSPLFKDLLAKKGLEAVKRELSESRARDNAILNEARRGPNLPNAGPSSPAK